MGYHAQFAYPPSPVDVIPQKSSESLVSTPQGHLSREDWIEWHSTDLHNLWCGLETYIQDTCLANDMLLPYSDYHDFCKYCYKNSTKKRSKNAT